ncbi:MAG: hypothetical protein KGZ25_07170, partial [Planctomycetes bacterium]|nr:hypothetical protein [Planctomycetota bacterium]
MRLSIPNAKIAIWDRRTKTGQLLPESDATPLAAEWDLSEEDAREELKTLLGSDSEAAVYVEGLEPGRAGEITLSYDGTDPAVKDTVQVTVVKVEITQVPDYLFADADYATPIRFKLIGLDGAECSLSDVQISFYVNGSEQFERTFGTSDGVKRTVGVNNDGALKLLSEYDEVHNGYTYECYVGSGAYENVSAGSTHRSGQASFRAEVTLGKCTVSSANETSTPAEGGRLRFYADANVPAMDIAIGPSDGIHPLDERSVIEVDPVRQTEGTRGIVHETMPTGGIPNWWQYYKYEPSNVTRMVGEKNERHMWFGVTVPTYEKYYEKKKATGEGNTELIERREVGSGKMFEAITAVDGDELSTAQIYLIEDGIDENEDPPYTPVVVTKNLGKREGAQVAISYGGKNGRDEPDELDRTRHAALKDVLASQETAMDLSKTGATIELCYRYYRGAEARVELDQPGPGENYLAEILGAGAVITSFFWEVGIPQGFSLASAIFSTMDENTDTSASRGGRARVGIYWSRIDPEGPDDEWSDVGISIHNSLTEEDGPQTIYRVRREIDVETGDEAQVYVDYGTEV